jgi:DeoR/GlpR family transcriptional regulator of sugar metabolism
MARHFGMSEVSIRKDLLYLERRGFLRRVHGGACVTDEMPALLDLSERYMVNRTAKRQIAKTAYALLDRPDLCIYLDTGTTTLLLAQAIPNDLPVTVVTSSLSTVAALEGKRGCRVIVPGGVVDYQRKILVGPWGDTLLDRFSFDLMFAGAVSVTLHGFACNEIMQTENLRRVISRARESYILADSSKVNRRGPTLFAAPNEVTAWITDRNVPRRFAKAIADRGGKIIPAGGAGR